MKQRGFILVEVITAVVVISTLLLMVSGVWQAHLKQQSRQNWIGDTHSIRAAVSSYWLLQSEPPATLAEALTPQQLSHLTVPWQQQWQLTESPSWLELSVTAPSAEQAEWMAGQVAGAFTQGADLVVPVWAPHAVTGSDNYLYRVLQPGQEHLNSMETDLNMSGHNLTQVMELDTQTLNAQSITAQSLTGTSLQVDTLSADILYALDVVTPNTRLSELRAELNEYQDLWKICQAQGKCP